MKTVNDTPLFLLIIAWFYSLFEKKRQFCSNCKYESESKCFHPLKQSGYNKIKMINGKCRGYKKYKI